MISSTKPLSRLVADVLNDVGRFLELVAPSFPHIFLLLVCLASVSSVSWIPLWSDIRTTVVCHTGHSGYRWHGN